MRSQQRTAQNDRNIAILSACTIQPAAAPPNTCENHLILPSIRFFAQHTHSGTPVSQCTKLPAKMCVFFARGQHRGSTMSPTLTVQLSNGVWVAHTCAGCARNPELKHRSSSGRIECFLESKLPQGEKSCLNAAPLPAPPLTALFLHLDHAAPAKFTPFGLNFPGIGPCSPKNRILPHKKQPPHRILVHKRSDKKAHLHASNRSRSSSCVGHATRQEFVFICCLDGHKACLTQNAENLLKVCQNSVKLFLVCLHTSILHLCIVVLGICTGNQVMACHLDTKFHF